MWFGFGLITLIVAVIVGLKTRLAARWKGVAHSHRDGPYQVQEVRNKNKLVMVRIGVDTPKPFNFVVRHERFHDRMFKWIGVTLELQTKDAEFDRKLFVESDARGVAILLRRNPELRKALVAISAIAKSNRLRRMRVRCLHGRLWVEFRPKDESVVYGVTQALVPLLHELKNGITAHRFTVEELRDPFVWRAAAVLALSTASLALGVYGLLRSAFGRTDIIDSGSLFTACAVPGVFAAGCVLITVMWWLGSTSRAHTVMCEFILVGGAGFILSTYALAREANIDFDFGAAETVVLSNVRAEHKVSRGRRGRRHHHYYLHTADWRPNHAGEHLRLEISEANYHTLANTKEAVVYVHRGALGFEWIEQIRPAW